MNYSDLFDYRDGMLFWKEKPARWMMAGAAAGSKNKSGHYAVSINGKKLYLHRIIWVMHNGEIPEGMVIDHINGNLDDNRIENLRCVSQHLNILNRRKQSNNSSGITGVSFHKQRKKWRATFQDVYLGLFNTFPEACEARIVAEVNSKLTTLRHGL